MKLSNDLLMDPHLLVGLVNTELRNNAKGLQDLCRTHDIDEKRLITRLAEGGYEWRSEQRAFR
jgi:hypothetical protein